MSDSPRRRFPHASFVGAFLGVIFSLVIPPPMMLTATGAILWILGWSTVGLVTGAVVGRIREID